MYSAWAKKTNTNMTRNTQILTSKKNQIIITVSCSQ